MRRLEEPNLFERRSCVDSLSNIWIPNHGRFSTFTELSHRHRKMGDANTEVLFHWFS